MVLGLLTQVASSQNFDINTLRYITENSNSNLTQVLEFTTNTTELTSMAIPSTVMCVGLIKKSKSDRLKALYIAECMAINTAFTYAVKYATDRTRPYDAYDINALHSEQSSSFPSGHTSIAFATATSLTMAYPKWYVAAPAYAWAGMVGYSRMDVGVHYPTDVLIGALLGVGSAYLSHFLNQQLFRTYQRPRDY